MRRLRALAGYCLAALAVVVSGVAGGGSSAWAYDGCPSGWSSLSGGGASPYYGCNTFVPGLVLADRDEAVAWYQAHKAGILAGSSIDDTTVLIMSAQGPYLGSIDPAYTGDGGPGESYDNPYFLGMTQNDWDHYELSCPCTVQLRDYGQDWGDGGLEFGASSAVMVALASWVSGDGSGVFSVAEVVAVESGLLAEGLVGSITGTLTSTAALIAYAAMALVGVAVGAVVKAGPRLWRFVWRFAP